MNPESEALREKGEIEKVNPSVNSLPWAGHCHLPSLKGGAFIISFSRGQAKRNMRIKGNVNSVFFVFDSCPFLHRLNGAFLFFNKLKSSDAGKN